MVYLMIARNGAHRRGGPGGRPIVDSAIRGLGRPQGVPLRLYDLNHPIAIVINKSYDI